MRVLLVALIGCGNGDCPKEPDCGDPACAAVCDADGDGAAAVKLGGDDCDDDNAAVFPGAPEVCGGLDDDCDGLIDDADPSVSELLSWYVDADGDGFGPDGDVVLGCLVEGRVSSGGDCDDSRADVAPGAEDVCDDVLDNNCDGQTDASEEDGDGDGSTLCGGDCADANPEVSPLAVEVCNDGVDDDCDGLVELDDPSADLWTCDYCPPWDGWNTGPIEVTTYNPCLLDPAAEWGCSQNPKNPDTHEDGTRLHRVAMRTDVSHYRPQLLLWFPPGPGNFNTKVLKMAAWAGYRSVLIGYPNEDLAWGQNCASDLGDCYANGRQEILWGDDASPYIDLGFADSAIGRVVALLEYLETENPGEGWGDYVNAAGDDVVWEDIIVMGWSEGGTNLGWLVHEVEPYGAIFLSSPEDVLFDVDQDLASFYYTPFATPGCAIWSAYHAEEPNLPFKLSLDEMEAPGVTTLIDDLDPPYGGTQRFVTYLTDFSWPDCTFHEGMGFDPCMSGLLGEAYVYALCEVGYRDREVECPWVP